MKDISSILAELNIAYDREDHLAVFTAEEAAKHVPPMNGIKVKNLFLRNKKDQMFALLVVPDEKRVDLKAFGKQEQFQNPSFAHAEQLQEMLGVLPGSATVLGIFHDTKKQVQVYLDVVVAASEFMQCHPLINTATLSIRMTDILRFLKHFEHAPKIVDVPQRI